MRQRNVWEVLAIGRLDFAHPDLDTFPCLRLGYRALASGGSAPAVLNAANEVAVQAFLERRVGFSDIPVVIDETLQRHPCGSVRSIEDLLEIDREARRIAEQVARGASACP